MIMTVGQRRREHTKIIAYFRSFRLLFNPPTGRSATSILSHHCPGKGLLGHAATGLATV